MIDLFETPELLSEDMQNLLLEWEERMSHGLGYEGCAALLKEAQAIGFTFDYGLDGDPYNLRRLV